jgi:DNA-binding NarL/FixJ family response regulator
MQEKTPMSQRIFLADDELNVRQALRLLLEQAGFVIIGEACDAENLLARVRTLPPDVILLDWELPGLRARRLLPTLRRCCSETKVVALSVRPDAKQNALAVGADAFISKGDPSDELLATLHSIAMRNK